MNENLRILVVDDEETILNVLREYLEVTNNYTVLTARDGLEALDIIKRESVHCCITDLSMPRLDGLELTEKIHLYDNTIPVIVMTGYPSMDYAIKTLKSGVVDFLTKPIKMDQLPLTIEKVMRDRSILIENALLKEEAKRAERLLKINQELHQKIKEVETINHIFQELDRATTRKDLFKILVNLSGEVTNCDEAHFCIFSEGMTGPAIITSFFKDKRIADAGYIDNNILKRVTDDGIPLLMRGGNGGDSIMAIPFKIRSRVFGILISITRDGNHRFIEKDLYLLNFMADKASFLIENMALYENIFENLFSTLYAFVETIEARDPYTKQHSARVTSYSISIAKAIGCSQEEMEVLNVSATLHDIGKIGVPDHILLKPGRLTEEEYAVIKRHPLIGSNIIGHQAMWIDEKDIIKHHHERWDGNGYPDGLKGEKAPFFSRILSVADVYDAMTSDRSYRKRLSEDAALREIQENAGTQFDPKIVEVFLGLYHQNKIFS